MMTIYSGWMQFKIILVLPNGHQGTLCMGLAVTMEDPGYQTFLQCCNGSHLFCCFDFDNSKWYPRRSPQTVGAIFIEEKNNNNKSCIDIVQLKYDTTQ